MFGVMQIVEEKEIQSEIMMVVSCDCSVIRLLHLVIIIWTGSMLLQVSSSPCQHQAADIGRKLALMTDMDQPGPALL